MTCFASRSSGITLVKFLELPWLNFNLRFSFITKNEALNNFGVESKENVEQKREKNFSSKAWKNKIRNLKHLFEHVNIANASSRVGQNHNLSHLDPNLRLCHAVRDLYSTDPAQETCAIDIIMPLMGLTIGTMMSYHASNRPGIYLPLRAIGDLCGVWNVLIECS